MLPLRCHCRTPLIFMPYAATAFRLRFIISMLILIRCRSLRCHFRRYAEICFRHFTYAAYFAYNIAVAACLFFDSVFFLAFAAAAPVYLLLLLFDISLSPFCRSCHYAHYYAISCRFSPTLFARACRLLPLLSLLLFYFLLPA